MKNKLKVSIVGTRGIPANYGGFETFAQEISPLLVNENRKITVYCDKPSGDHSDLYKGVELRYSTTTKTKNPLLYYFNTLRQALKRSDVVIVAGTAGAFFYILNIFYGKTIVTNCDGIESRRTKWKFLKRTFVRATEIVAMRLSKIIIADSKGIANYLISKYSKKIHAKIRTIEYGASINEYKAQSVLNKYGVSDNNYFLVVSRLEPENNIQLIIEGYHKSKSNKPLIIIGNKLETEYVKRLLTYSSSSIVFLGGIYNPLELAALRTSCFAYIHGHSVGGTNPSLLEAMGSKNICICHDNIFNREVTTNEMFYFSDAESLSHSICTIETLDSREISRLKNISFNRITSYYNWQNIANKYSELLNEIEKTLRT